MSSVILTNWTVFYADDAGAGNGYKQIRWTGGGGPETNTNTVNELYSALADLFSIAAQNDADDTIPIRAVTPTVYEIGSFDAGDLEPWFIDPISVQHLTGGSLETVGWTRSLPGDGTGDIGILMVQCNTGGTFTMTSSDVGDTCSHSDGDSGIILYVDTTNSQIWIRPDSNALANDFNSTTGGTITAGTSPNRTVVQTTSVVGTSDERLWANIFTIGTISSGTQIYVAQNFTNITAFWSTGHIDRLFLVDDGFDAGLIDSGLLTIFAREFSKLYDHFTADVSAGGRNPIPLSTSTDINNATLEATIAALTGITFTYGATQEDIGDGSNNKPYDVSINCGGNFLDDFYEYTKYVTRRTATTPLSTNYYSRDGEQYITVGELRIAYDGQTGAFAQGEVLTGPSGTAFIIADHNNGDNTGTLIVRDVRGTFSDNDTLTDAVSGAANVFGDPEDTLVSKVAPFGTFAGGRFFGARGVWITNVHANDSNNYQLIDSNGVTRNPPVSVPIVVGGLVSGDSVSVFRATGAGEGPHKTYLTSTALDNSAGDTTFIVQESIPGDTPAEGTLRLVDKFSDATQNKEYRIRYSSWATSTFTFASQTGLDANGTSSTTLTDSGATFQTWGIKHGDLIRNTTEGVIAYVISVDSQTELTTTAVTDWTGDSYEINTLPVTTTADDTAYAPYIDTRATGTSVSVSVTYVTDRPLIARVRRKGIVPFSIANTTLTNTGASISAIRNPDNIAQ